MKILAIDIGTGTQDILLYDSLHEIENCYRLILPSPTFIFSQKIKKATRNRTPILLSGVMMGGGPITLAVENHIKSGFPVYATEDAARTFNDDLLAVERMGVQLVSENEIPRLQSPLCEFKLKDLDFPAILSAFGSFHVNLDDLDALAIAVLDHGAAPPGVSDRKYRFDYLRSRICEQNKLTTFAFLSTAIPPDMTRLQTVADTAASLNIPTILMDTAPSAVLGATYLREFDPTQQSIIVNIGNSHTLAFHIANTEIIGLFEHHTAFLSSAKLEDYLIALAQGMISNDEIFSCHGHGALLLKDSQCKTFPSLFVTGPRRNLLFKSRLNPIFAAPFGDMMTTGCIGLLAATAELLPDFRRTLLASLNNN